MFMGTNRVPTGSTTRSWRGRRQQQRLHRGDRTNYFDVGPSNLLPTLLWLEADRLEELGKSMTLRS